MAIDRPTIRASLQTPTFATAAQSEREDFIRLWAAWQAKEAEHERAIRRHGAIIAAVLIVATAVVVYWALVLA